MLGVSSRVVHWSRVIHIAENAGGTGVYGLPRLQSVYNRLEDLLKIMAGSGESAWRLLYKGWSPPPKTATTSTTATTPSPTVWMSTSTT